ncbi:MAG: hypothetical protein R2744_08355 [Bacteroidales bacterium]
MFEPILYNSANQWLNRTWYYNNEMIQFYCPYRGEQQEAQCEKIFRSISLKDSRDWYGFWNHYATYGRNIDPYAYACSGTG